MNLDVKSTHELINKFYADPILNEWKPSEYDLKYIFPPTPRGQLKLAKRKAKEDAKLKEVFDKEVASKANVHHVVDEIAKYPAEIQKLFFNVFEWKINNLVKCHEEFLKLKDELPKFGEYISKRVYDFRYHLTKTTTDISSSGRRISRRCLRVLDDDDWNKLAATTRGDFREVSEGKWEYEYPLKNVEDPTALMEFLVKYFEAHDRDDIAIYGDKAYVNAIIHIASMLTDILHDIDMHFNGNKPTLCETDAHWGVDGHFNGILSDGNTRASFKSFGAGGWNIVRFHYRFKITKLKSK